jgi:polyisoprenyl-teichoic acid--peptidoglycan teichoic acid transferase
VAKHRAGPAQRSWGQRLFLTVGVLLTLLSLGAATFVVSVYVKLGELVRFSEDEVAVDESAPGVPENFLIVGSDSRDNVDPSDPDFADVLPNSQVGGTRSDTIIVARVDPASTTVDMVSFPRDLFVPIAGRGRDRINSAYGDGRQVLIDTIRQDFGIEINHYIEVDFTGFQRLVSAVGGVPVYLDTVYRDRRSGLGEIGPGCAVLDGETALAFARARNLEFQDADGDWRLDPTGDLGRITRQQLFIRRAIERVLALDLSDILTLNRLLDVAVDSVAVDAGLSNDDLRGLANRFRGFNPDTIRNHSLPTEPFRTSAGAAVLGLLEDQAQPILNVFRGLDPGAVTADRVVVEVQNGTGVEQQATLAAEALDFVGFVTQVNRDAPAAPPATTIFFGPGSEEAARLLARHLTSRATFEFDASLEPLRVRLVTGPDFTTVVRQPWAEDAVAAPTTTTTTVPADPASTTTTTAPTTTTSVVGVVPDAPPPGVEC